MSELRDDNWDDSLSKQERRRIRRQKRKERQDKMEQQILERATDVIQLALDQQIREVSNTPVVQQPRFRYVQSNGNSGTTKSQGRYQGVGSQTGCVACKRRLFDPI
jgi:hypothetical protein